MDKTGIKIRPFREAVGVHFLHTCIEVRRHDLFSLSNLLIGERRWRNEEPAGGRRQDEGLSGGAHHEAWKRSDLNQRQYCEAQGIPLKTFGKRATFKAEPQPPERKLLYWRRRRG